jgi:uncharacterized protein YdaU (DUF1376 family)
MASKWQVWYPHIIDAWQGSATIQTFSHAAYRAYHNLIMEQFQAEDGKLPDDDRQLAKLSRLGAEWEHVAPEVRPSFTADGNGKLYSKTQFELWEHAHGRHLEHVARMEEINKRRNEARNKNRNESRNDDRNDGATMAATNPATNAATTERERETETETEILKTKDVSAAASATPTIFDLPAPVEALPPAPANDANGNPIWLPLITGTMWPVMPADCLTWAAAFPGVNVLTELLKIGAWLDANPKNRKTPNGIKRFIVSWMSRAQNQSRPNGGSNGVGNRGQARTDGNLNAARVAAERMAAKATDGAC